MIHRNGTILTVGIAALVLASTPALAMSPLTIKPTTSMIVPVVDQEDLSVEEDMVPDEVPAGEEASEPMEAAPKSEGKETIDTGDTGLDLLEKNLEVGD